MDVFSALRSGILRFSAITIDNSVFKLHYRATVIILIAFSLLVTARQYIGDPIDCMSTGSAIPNQILDQYCWISTTFSLPYSYNKPVGVEVPYPGVDQSIPGQPKVYHQYYQWVCFVLFLQAIMFYLPHYLWKIWEGGRIRALANGLQLPNLPEAEVESKRDAILFYFRRSLRNHNFYYARFFFCEILNFAHVVGQIYFTDRFLGGAFVNYGTDVVKYSELTNQHNRTDPMVRVFPRVTKCTFYTFGASGDIQTHDALCVLPINIINEKIYIFLWFWFVLLALISGLDVIFRAGVTISSRLRYLLLRMTSRFAPYEYLRKLNERLPVGDWFVLYQLGQSIDNRTFGNILIAMTKYESDGKTDENWHS